MAQPGDPTFALLTLADMVGPVSHDLRNVFNNMVLKSAVLARAVPEPLRNDVGEFRALAMRATELLNGLDRYRRDIAPIRQPVDLNQAVREAVEQARHRGCNVTTHLTPSLPPVQAEPKDLCRLIHLLVHLAAAFPESKVAIAVATEQSESTVRLCVRDAGPPLTEEEADAFFAPFGPARAGQAGLERAACQTIAQRLHAELRAENRPEGVTVIVGFRAS